MDVHVDNPELERKLSDLAQKSGRAADDLIQDALAGYFEELGTLRSSLDARYDEIKTGRVQLIDGEKAFDALKAKSEERRNRTARAVSRYTPTPSQTSTTSGIHCR